MKFQALIAVMFLAAAQNGAQASPQSEETFIQSINEALTLIRDEENCAAALDILIPAVSDPRYQSLTPDSKALIQANIIDCGLSEQRWQDTMNAVNAYLALRGDNEVVLWYKVLLGDIVDQPLASLSAAQRLAVIAPQKLSDIKLRTIWSLLRKLEETDEGDKRREFLDALWSADYTPPDPAASLDGLRMTYARLLRDELMTSRAADLIKQVTSPTLIADYLIDRRYDPVRRYKGMPKIDDMPDILSAFVASEKKLMEDLPQSLSATLNYIQALRLSGQYVEAEEQAAAIAEAMGESADASPYEDFDDYANWLMNEWAYTLYDLGFNEKGREAMLKSLAFGEDQGSNVSQTINYAVMLQMDGLYDDSLAEIAKLDLDATSPFGIMWAKSVYVCVRAFQGSLSDEDADLAYLREHRDDNTSALQRSLICANEIDEAAALYIERLEDLDERVQALYVFQNTLQPPHVQPNQAELQKRIEAIKARPDVQEAVNAVGRVYNFPFYPTYWGDL